MQTTEISWFERITQWFRHSLSIKLLSIGIIMLLLMIPNAMVKDLIRERKGLQANVIQEVSSKWGEAQTLIGPILSIPFRTTIMDEEGDAKELTQMAYFLPDQLQIDGTILPEVRNRSLYKVNLYKADLEISGQFGALGLNFLELETAQLDWDKAKVIFGIPDMTGIENNILLQWGTEPLRMQPGISKSADLRSGVSVPVPIGARGIEAAIPFSLTLNLKGSQTIHFAPIGKETIAKLTSDWTTPSFDGTFLPDQHQINEQGFIANWQILDFNRNYPQQWVGQQNQLAAFIFGLRLFPPVDEYKKNTRSAKYAFLLISLSFMVFFFFEIINGLNIHAIQYIFIGLAISVFYILLLSLSEHLGFNKAYWLSAFATIGLIVGYSSAILKDSRRTGILTLILVALYSFIFIILQLEDYALLAGSIGLFAVLAIAMLLSRKIDWYQLKRISV